MTAGVVVVVGVASAANVVVVTVVIAVKPLRLRLPPADKNLCEGHHESEIINILYVCLRSVRTPFIYCLHPFHKWQALIVHSISCRYRVDCGRSMAIRELSIRRSQKWVSLASLLVLPWPVCVPFASS